LTTAPVSGKPLVPLKPGLFRLPEAPDAPVRLLGSACNACGEVFFPARHYCAACSSGDMREVELSSHGHVQTYTIVHQQLTGSVMVPPYAIVRVALDDGPVVQTVLVKSNGDPIAIDDEVEIVALPVAETAEGGTVVSFAARPLAARQGGS
jgi:uncharacterized OB-fold protein